MQLEVAKGRRLLKVNFDPMHGPAAGIPLRFRVDVEGAAGVSF